MELRVLRYFLMVAAGGEHHPCGAASACDPATLSRQIQDLEEELGTKLFVRSNHRIVLTQEGCCYGARPGDRGTGGPNPAGLCP